MARMHSLEQERAIFAWEKIAGVRKEFKEEYKNLAKGAPALLMSNGLMQTLAFYNSRDKKAAEALAGHIQEWISKKIAGIAGTDFAKVMKGLQTCQTAEYMRATDEALEILRWIRQFADALIKKED